MRRLSTVFILLLLAACAQGKNPWSAIKTTSPGPVSSIGTYTNGCLAGAESLPPDGRGYQIMRLTRGRFYGNPLLIHYIQKLGKEAAKQHQLLLIGDMAQPRGGPIPDGHTSHQTGLDVDIWYTHPPKAITARLTLKEREELSAASLVLADGSAIDPQQWDKRYTTILRLAASQKDVDRIFVHPAIKKQLCSIAKGSAWLRKIRPWWLHNDHFHVRLACPANDTNCVAQTSPIPAGDGCDTSLDWWFTDEAKTMPTASSTKTADMPKQCTALLQSK